MPSTKRKAPRKVKSRVNEDRRLRLKVFELMADANIEGKVLIENMDMVVRWIRNGKPTLVVSTGQ